MTSLFAPLLIGKAIDVNPKDNLGHIQGWRVPGPGGMTGVKLTHAALAAIEKQFQRYPKEYFQKRNVFVVGGEALNMIMLIVSGRSSPMSTLNIYLNTGRRKQLWAVTAYGCSICGSSMGLTDRVADR